MNVCEAPYVDEIAEENVLRTLDDIREKSAVIADLEAAGSIMLIGAMYDISTGRVRLIGENAPSPDPSGE
jgi:carbonic anhydrase